MKKLLLLFVLPVLCFGQGSNKGGNIVFPGAPTGACTSPQIAVNAATGDQYNCLNSVWNLVTGGGGGAVSSVFTRTGAVVATSGDYSVAQVTGAAPLASPTFTGHITTEGITATGATGTGNFVFSIAPAITGHPTIEGVTSTGSTGTGKFVFDTSPTLSNPVVGTQSALDNSTKAASTAYVDAATKARFSNTVLSLQDNFGTALATNGNIGQLGWTLSAVGSAPIVTIPVGTYPHRTVDQLATNSGATQGQGGVLSPSSAAWGDYGTNTGWSVAYTFALNQTASDVFYIGLATSITALRSSGFYLRFDTNNPLSGAAITGIVCTTTICTVTMTGTHNLVIVGQTVTISGETCPTRNVNSAQVVTLIPSGTTWTFTAGGAAETCTVQGTATSSAETNFFVESRAADNNHAVAVNTGVAADTSFHTITIASTVAGTEVFTLDANSPITLSTFPSTSTLFPTIIMGTDTTAQKSVLINWFNYIETGLSR